MSRSQWWQDLWEDAHSHKLSIVESNLHKEKKRLLHKYLTMFQRKTLKWWYEQKMKDINTDDCFEELTLFKKKLVVWKVVENFQQQNVSLKILLMIENFLEKYSMRKDFRNSVVLRDAHNVLYTSEYLLYELSLYVWMAPIFCVVVRLVLHSFLWTYREYFRRVSVPFPRLW